MCSSNNNHATVSMGAQGEESLSFGVVDTARTDEHFQFQNQFLSANIHVHNHGTGNVVINLFQGPPAHRHQNLGCSRQVINEPNQRRMPNPRNCRLYTSQSSSVQPAEYTVPDDSQAPDSPTSSIKAVHGSPPPTIRLSQETCFWQTGNVSEENSGVQVPRPYRFH